MMWHRCGTETRCRIFLGQSVRVIPKHHRLSMRLSRPISEGEGRSLATTMEPERNQNRPRCGTEKCGTVWHQDSVPHANTLLMLKRMRHRKMRHQASVRIFRCRIFSCNHAGLVANFRCGTSLTLKGKYNSVPHHYTYPRVRVRVVPEGQP